MLCITNIDYFQNKSLLEIKGKMLTNKFGVYACKIFNGDTNKDIIPPVNPEKIDFDRSTSVFVVNLTINENPFQGARKFIELFVRTNPDSIPYKLKNNNNF